jgi:hypothetical protein
LLKNAVHGNKAVSIMNPGNLLPLAEDRVRELRRLARPLGRTDKGTGRARRSPGWALLRPVGLTLVRMGTALAGPEPRGTVVAFRRADWGRPY